MPPTTVTAPVAITGIAADEAGRRVFICSLRSLYEVSYDNPSSITLLGTFSGVDSNLMHGLAWDSTRSRLLATGGNGVANTLYEVDITNARCVPLGVVSSADFGGIDYDAAGDRIIATQDINTTFSGLTGRGVYEWVHPFTGPPVKLADYPFKSPGVLERDIDGLGVGNGRAYLCADEANWLYVFNLSSRTYETPIAQPMWATDRVGSACTFAPSFLSAGTYDAALTVSTVPTCTYAAGQTVPLTYTVANTGGATLAPVTLDITLPPGVTLVDCVPTPTVTPGGLRVQWPQLILGQSTQVQLQVRSAISGEVTIDGVVTSGQTEVTLSNNVTSSLVRITPSPPTSATATALAFALHSGAGSPAPGASGLTFAPGFTRLYASASGEHFITLARAIAPAITDSLIVSYAEGTFELVARENTSPLVPGDAGQIPPLALDSSCAINDAGEWAFSGSDGRVPTILTDQGPHFVARGSGRGNAAGTTFVARAGESVPGVFDAAYADPRHGLALSNAGLLSFAARISGASVTPANQWVLLGSDGSDLLARTGQSIPSGQSNGAGSATFFPLLEIDSAALRPSTSFSRDADAGVVGVGGRIAASQAFPPPGGADSVAMFSDIERGGLGVKAQENCDLNPLVNALAADGDPIQFAYVEPSGPQVLIVRDQRPGRVVIINDARVAGTGDEAISGGVLWSTAPGTFAAVTARPSITGDIDYVIIGEINTTDTRTNSVAILNATHTLAREGDPVDLDGNGQFDEDAYIAGFAPNGAILSPSHATFIVTLRSFAANIGCAADVSLGEAVIRIPRPDAVTPSCPADFNQDGGIDGVDVEAFFVDWSNSLPNADVNLDGGVDGSDVEFFFVLWTAGGC